MNACLRLALFGATYDSDLVDAVRDLPAGERTAFYGELTVAEVHATQLPRLSLRAFSAPGANDVPQVHSNWVEPGLHEAEP